MPHGGHMRKHQDESGGGGRGGSQAQRLSWGFQGKQQVRQGEQDEGSLVGVIAMGFGMHGDCP